MSDRNKITATVIAPITAAIQYHLLGCDFVNSLCIKLIRVQKNIHLVIENFWFSTRCCWDQMLVQNFQHITADGIQLLLNLNDTNACVQS